LEKNLFEFVTADLTYLS